MSVEGVALYWRKFAISFFPQNSMNFQEKYSEQAVFVALAMLGLIILLLPQESLEHVTALILWITGIVVAWYSWETYRLRRTTEVGLQAEDRPVLVSRSGPDILDKFRADYPERNYWAIFGNVGRGPALDVFHLEFKDGRFGVLPVNQAFFCITSSDYYPIGWLKDGSSFDEIIASYDCIKIPVLKSIKDSGYPHLVMIVYMDVRGAWYYSLLNMYKKTNGVISYGLLENFKL